MKEIRISLYPSAWFTMEGRVRAEDWRSYIAGAENKVNIILQAFTILVNLLHPKLSLFISDLFSFILFLSVLFKWHFLNSLELKIVLRRVTDDTKCGDTTSLSKMDFSHT